MTDFQNIIDSDKYPIFGDNKTETKAVFETFKMTYDKTGVISLPNFLKPDALSQIVKDAQVAERFSFKKIKHHNVYLLDSDPEYGEDHPRNRILTTTNSTVSYADIAEKSLLRTLYLCEPLHRFIAYVTGKKTIYPYVDQLSPLNIGVSRPDETLAWHFDTSDFATTLMLQTPQKGGDFEYVPHIRTKADPAYSRVEQLLDGDRGDVQTLNVEAGTLVLFQGRHSIHRVAPVQGDVTRMMAILTYDEKPDQQMNAYTQQKFYGRSN